MADIHFSDVDGADEADCTGKRRYAQTAAGAQQIPNKGLVIMVYK